MTISRALAFCLSHVSWVFSESLYLRIRYRLLLGRKLNLENPILFNEKIQWLKIHDRNPLYTVMVDKYLCKAFVAKLIGEEHVVKLLGVWDSVDDINLDALPEKFVLKTTNGGGNNGVIICRDKSSFDLMSAKSKLKKNLKTNAYRKSIEWVYKDIKPRIIAEELLELPDSEDLRDYKFFCFNGSPEFLKVDFNRNTYHQANYYDLDWNVLPFGETLCPPDPKRIEQCPSNFHDMLDIVRKLCRNIPFVRVDLYNCNGKIYFGELTFYPNAGFGSFTSDEWDEKIGKMLYLPDTQGVIGGAKMM